METGDFSDLLVLDKSMEDSEVKHEHSTEVLTREMEYVNNMEDMDGDLDTISRSLIPLSTQLPDFSEFICLVCGDHASGKYYHVASCNGCRGFFRRSVMQNLHPTYHCHRAGNCPMVMRDRNLCRACRYKKCITCGMRPEYVLKFHEKKKNKPLKKQSNMKGGSARNQDLAGIMVPIGQGMNITYLVGAYNGSLDTENGILQACPRVDGNVVQSDWISYVNCINIVMQGNVVSSVEWAKRIPGFRDLEMGDQIALLRSSVDKQILLQNIYRTVKASSSNLHLVLADNVVVPWFDKETFERVAAPYNIHYRKDMLKGFHNLLKGLRETEVSDHDLVCFKALLLFDPNCKGLRNSQKVKKLRNQVQDMIFDETKSNDSLARKVMQLLLLMPVFESVVSHIKDSVKDGFFNIATVPKIVKEMLFDAEMI